MYSETDIEAAIASGAISPQAAAALRASVASSRATPLVDEESFRLITGFNDIFVTIAAVLLLVAVGWIGASLVPAPRDAEQLGLHMGGSVGVGGFLVAGASWALAEYFTRHRRMALPSIVLLASFVYGVAAGQFGLLVMALGAVEGRTVPLIVAFIGLTTAFAAYVHWRRFHVPITVAALTGALVVTLLALLLSAVPRAGDSFLGLMLLAGIGVFAFAMWWDISDRQRLTRRSDVAFWLHLAAAPMIAHPIFWLLGVTAGTAGPATALLVLGLYVVFGIVALAVDRRALLVSSLVYVLWSLSALFRQAGAVGLDMAFTALVIGSLLLLLSAFWHNARRLVVKRLPDEVRRRLPELDRPATAKT